MIVPVELTEPANLVVAPVGPQIPIREPQGPVAPTLVKEARPQASAWRKWILLWAVVLVMAGLLGYWKWRGLGGRAQPANGRLMLAVLPFENLTGDPSQEYLTDGLTEEMIAQLGRLDPAHFGVIARTSVMPYKRNPERLAQIGKELGVQYVLEGSLRRASENIRVSAQLSRVKDQSHIWAKEYDRQLVNLLTLQDEIAREISGEIELTLGEAKPKPIAMRPSLSHQQLEAYDLYLKGLYFWNKRTVEGFRQAIKYYQEAIAKDPAQGPSYAGMADCYAMIGGYSGEPRLEYITQARRAALRALEIDRTLSEAHTALAVIVQNYDWDWQTAEKEYRRAIDLNPNYATAHHWYSEHLGLMGRFDDAIRESGRARQLDPLSLIIATDNAVLLYYARQYDLSIRQFQAVMELDPNFSRLSKVVFPYVARGMFPEALEAALRPGGKGPWFWAVLAYVYGRSGKREEAQGALVKLTEMSRLTAVDPGAFVIAYLGTTDTNATLTWLERAYAQHSDVLTTLKVDPIYDPLRSDPRFKDLERRVGLAL